MKSEKTLSKKDIFENLSVTKALYTMAIPTIISQLINLIYNMVDAFFIGRTGNSYMMAATSLTLTLVLLNIAFSNLFGIGGGSLIARLMGQKKESDAKSVSSFCIYGAVGIAVLYSTMIGLFLKPILHFFGASESTFLYAKQYTILVIVIGSLPAVLSATLAHLLRNVGCAKQASLGLSSGGILNVILDPIFMFVLLPKGYEVVGAALATLISNIFSCIVLLVVFSKASKSTPITLNPGIIHTISKKNTREVFAVGVPSAILTGLFDLANICVNMLASAHNDLVLAGMGIVMKVERIPNAINIGICQGMLPIVAYNYASKNTERMKATIRTARIAGLGVSLVSILLLELFAKPITTFFLSTNTQEAQTAIQTIGYATLFLQIRCLASPVQFINYHTSYCLQAMGKGVATMVHASVRELVCYIPLMFLLDGWFQEAGLASSLPLGEGIGAVFALFLLSYLLRKKHEQPSM